MDSTRWLLFVAGLALLPLLDLLIRAVARLRKVKDRPRHWLLTLGTTAVYITALTQLVWYDEIRQSAWYWVPWGVILTGQVMSLAAPETSGRSDQVQTTPGESVWRPPPEARVAYPEWVPPLVLPGAPVVDHPAPPRAEQPRHRPMPRDPWTPPA